MEYVESLNPDRAELDSAMFKKTIENTSRKRQ
jgi:hypothetical protein